MRRIPHRSVSHSPIQLLHKDNKTTMTWPLKTSQPDDTPVLHRHGIISRPTCSIRSLASRSIQLISAHSPQSVELTETPRLNTYCASGGRERPCLVCHAASAPPQPRGGRGWGGGAGPDRSDRWQGQVDETDSQ